MESLNLKTLADFKRFLARPGAAVRIVRHDWFPDPNRAPHLWELRTVAKLQTNGVAFTDGERLSWLYWRGAKNIRFDGDKVSIVLDPEKAEPPLMVYECSILGARS